MRALCAAMAVAVALLAGAASAAAVPPPKDLIVEGGSQTWQATAEFSLRLIPPDDRTGLAATDYRVRESAGRTVREGRFGWVNEWFYVNVPEYPDVFTAEAWYEDGAGNAGPATTAALRFDNQRPSAVEPERLPDWIGRNAFPLRVRISHPAHSPLSGIGGYAVAVDGERDGSPCAAVDLCTAAETTLHAGLDGDVFEILGLPEGTDYLHAVAVSGAGMHSATVGQETLQVDLTDPVTYLNGAPDGWADHPVTVVASASDDGAGMGEGGPWAPFTALRIDGGAPIVSAGDTATATVIPEGEHLVSYYARDAAGNVNDGAAVNGVKSHPPRTAWVRIDRTPPRVAFANSQEPADPDLIRVHIADSLSGPDSSRGWIGVRPLGSNDPFQGLPAEPGPSDELRARWRSDSLPLGEYEFEAVGYDAAGNATRTTKRADGTPMVLSNPLKTTATLHDSFQGGDLRRLVPYGHGVGLSGHLIAGLRTPVGGEPVRVVERFAAGARPGTRVSTVRTDQSGAFSVTVPPGPSRTIDLVYDGTATLSRTSGETLELRTRGRVRLGASAKSAKVGGRPVVFRGRVSAAAGTIPKGGVPVQLQFRFGHSAWSQFRTVQANRRGRFRYAYRFSDNDSRGIRFQFRAYLPARDGWPYEPAGSRPVAVRGR